MLPGSRLRSGVDEPGHVYTPKYLISSLVRTTFLGLKFEVVHVASQIWIGLYVNAAQPMRFHTRASTATGMYHFGV